MNYNKIACVGAGTIGHSWATLFAMKGLTVNLQDMNDEILSGAMARIKANLTFLVEKEVIKPTEVEATLNRIHPTTSLEEAVIGVEYVQESVAERYEVKKDIFAQMDAATSQETILASSSSFLLMTEIQKVTSHPQRCLLAHPYNPPHMVPVVEIVPGKQTGMEPVNITIEFMRKIGKTPVLLKKEVSGYISNRLQLAIWKEILAMVEEDVATVEDIDLALSAGPGIRWAIMGPSLILHLAGGPGGIDHAIEIAGFMLKEFSPSTIQSWVQGIKEMELVRTKSVEELAKWRDEKLVDLLKILY